MLPVIPCPHTLLNLAYRPTVRGVMRVGQYVGMHPGVKMLKKKQWLEPISL